MRLFAVALAITLSLTACGAALDGGGGSTPAGVETAASTGSEAPPAATSTVVPEPTATAEPPQTVSDERCGGSLEGCFTYDEMDEYVAAILPMVQQYFTTAYEGLPEPEVVYIPSGRAARGYCGVSTSEAYEYCSADQTIYVGQDLIWAFYRQAGDAAPAVALAHEWGHHLQFMLDVPFAQTRAEAIAFENQADCIAGAWAQYADGQGWLEDDDLSDIETLLQLIGSRESRARDHGTTAERSEAFELSYEGGIAACNAYFPDSPLG
jgi:predicted metalloprotease